MNRVREAVRWRASRLWWEAKRRRTRRVNRLGLDLTLNMRSNGQRLLYETGVFEPHLSGYLARELRKGDVFVDVGAHIGLHALPVARRLAELGGGHVYAFEPAPDTADRLQRAAERNGISNVTLIRAAVGERSGTLALHTDPAYGVDDPGVRSAYGPGKAVGEFPSLSLDDWAAGLDRLDIVKVDIEGGEHAAMVGARATLTRLQPRLVVLEQGPEVMARAGVTEQQLADELARSGYREAERLADHDHAPNVVYRRLGT